MILIFFLIFFIFVNYNLQGPTENRLGEWVPWINIFIIIIIIINEHNLGKNPNWREADQLAIYKRRREAEFGATENNIS